MNMIVDDSHTGSLTGVQRTAPRKAAGQESKALLPQIFLFYLKSAWGLFYLSICSIGILQFFIKKIVKMMSFYYFNTEFI